MRLPLLPILVFSALGTASFSFAGPTRRPDLNAFINRKVVNTPGLVNQVMHDPEVADRYSRHFAMSRRELVEYLTALRPGKLAKSEVYTVYSVPEDGRVKMHRERLKSGAPIFVDRAGRPTLIMKCGNPLVLGPSRARKGNLTTVEPIDTDTDKLVSMLDPRDVPLLEADEMALSASQPAVPEVIVADDVPLGVPPVAVSPINTVAATSTGGSRFPLFAALPLLIPIIGSLDHNGGGGGGGDTQPVPEPATLVGIAVGAAALARRRRKATR